jgi:hypothetical protein
MNYLKIYCRLIRKAENRTPPEGYIEKHHTFPKSIFGKNNRIVVLTAREHSVAHALLEKIYLKRCGIENWKTQKMIFAYCNMSASNQYHKNRYINSRLYESSRIRKSKIMSGENNPFYGKKHSDEVIAKIKQANTGRNMIITEEHAKKISESKKGKPLSKKCRERCKEINTGNTYRLGTKHTDETKEKMRKRREGLKWWNDGKSNVMKRECPGEEWKPGRLYYTRNK